MSSKAPYLSVVVTSRNDNHGGTLQRRMQIFIDCLIAQCKRHDVPAELIIVEWNPPVDRPKLAEAMRWPADLGPCVIRIIEVPPELHARYRFAKQLPLYQMIAKNVGIRRARGEFILATNIDVIFNDELMQHIKSGRLERGHLYRIDRTDVDALVPEGASMEQTLDYCRTHVLRINAREGTFPLRPDGLRALARLDVAREESGIALGLGWFEAESFQPPGAKAPCATRWVDNDAEIWIKGPESADPDRPRYICLDLQPGPSVGHGPFILRARDASGNLLHKQAIFQRQTFCFPVHIAPDKLDKITLHADSQRLPAGHHHDPRTLNFLVFAVDVRDAPPDQLTSPDIAGPGVGAGIGWYGAEEIDGLIQRWATNDAEVWIEMPPEGQAQPRYLALDIEPGPGVGQRPFLLRVGDATNPAFFQCAVLRRQTVNIPLALAPDRLHRLRLSLDSPNLPYADDTRLLNFRSRGMALSADPVQSPTIPDIMAAEAPIAFGTGIYGVESTESGVCRWLDNNADLWIVPDAGGQPPPRYLRLDLQPGPSVGHEPFVLEVGGAVAEQRLSYPILARQTISIPLALAPGEINRVTLRLDSPRCPVPDDPRTLNALLLGAELSNEPAPAAKPETVADVADPGEIRFGSGWFSPETSGGQWLRWADNDAVLWISAPGERPEPHLELELQPGPSLGKQPLLLEIVDAEGKAVASERLSERRTIRIRLPQGARPLWKLTLTTPTPRLAVKNDSRILNFALYRACLTDGGGPTPSLPIGDNP